MNRRDSCAGAYDLGPSWPQIANTKQIVSAPGSDPVRFRAFLSQKHQTKKSNNSLREENSGKLPTPFRAGDGEQPAAKSHGGLDSEATVRYLCEKCSPPLFNEPVVDEEADIDVAAWVGCIHNPAPHFVAAQSIYIAFEWRTRRNRRRASDFLHKKSQ